MLITQEMLLKAGKTVKFLCLNTLGAPCALMFFGNPRGFSRRKLDPVCISSSILVSLLFPRSVTQEVHPCCVT